MDHLIEGVGLAIIASSFGLGYGVRALISARRKTYAREHR
jgi:hypothetical protein